VAKKELVNRARDRGPFGLYSYNRDQSHQAALQEIMGKRTYERYQSAEQQAAEDKAEEQARESE
jgi:hypothetical protein